VIAVFADMHDGEMKKVTIVGQDMLIEPYENEEKWAVITKIDTVHCNAIVDFNVAGKPNPPPVNLTATAWAMITAEPQREKASLEFTDPSGTLAPPDMPLNVWIMIKTL